MTPSDIKSIAVHRSATKYTDDIGVKEIRSWYTKAPKNWSDIGYHFVICRDGTWSL